MQITSQAFQHEGAIPSECTCDDVDIAPELSWSGTPGGTKTFALIVDDPDAPDPKAPKMTYVHWVLYDIPPPTSGVPKGGKTPTGARDGKNDWRRAGYGGPCPPIGRHRYYFKLYALDILVGELRPATKDQLVKAMQGHVLAEAVLMGTYQRRG